MLLFRINYYTYYNIKHLLLRCLRRGLKEFLNSKVFTTIFHLRGQMTQER